MLDISDLKVLYEDNHLIAVYKQAGWLVQGDRTGDTPLSEYVKEYVKIRYRKPGDVFLGVIHRLDRPVSGVVIFARTSKGLQRMNKLFADRAVQKEYWAVSAQRPKPIEGKLTHFLLKDRERNVSKAYQQVGRRTKDAKKSTLTYKLLASVGDHHLLEVNPETGRPHQIRVQLSELGCSIRGDLKYGAPRANKDGSIHLHCRSLSFVHPVKKEPIQIFADAPKEQVWQMFTDVMN